MAKQTKKEITAPGASNSTTEKKQPPATQPAASKPTKRKPPVKTETVAKIRFDKCLFCQHSRTAGHNHDGFFPVDDCTKGHFKEAPESRPEGLLKGKIVKNCPDFKK